MIAPKALRGSGRAVVEQGLGLIGCLETRVVVSKSGGNVCISSVRSGTHPNKLFGSVSIFRDFHLVWSNFSTVLGFYNSKAFILGRFEPVNLPLIRPCVRSNRAVNFCVLFALFLNCCLYQNAMIIVVN